MAQRIHPEEIRVYYSYVQEDQELRQKLDQHLAILRYLYHITTWYDRNILAGEHKDSIIHEQLNSADIILLLISAPFIKSDYCYSGEMMRALERHKQNKARVVPILLRPVFWQKAPFSHIEVLPQNQMPVTSWANQDEAFVEIARGIERVIEDLLQTRQKIITEPPVADSCPLTVVDSLGDLTALVKAISAGPQRMLKSPYQGNAQTDLQEAEEDLARHPLSASAMRMKMRALLESGQFEQALQTFAGLVQPGLYAMAVDFSDQAYALIALGHYAEALQACEEALRQKPQLAVAWKNKAQALLGLGRYQEALLASQQALLLMPDLVAAYALTGIALYYLQRYADASKVFAQWETLRAQYRPEAME